MQWSVCSCWACVQVSTVLTQSYTIVAVIITDQIALSILHDHMVWARKKQKPLIHKYYHRAEQHAQVHAHLHGCLVVQMSLIEYIRGWRFLSSLVAAEVSAVLDLLTKGSEPIHIQYNSFKGNSISVCTSLATSSGSWSNIAELCAGTHTSPAGWHSCPL